MLDPTELFQRQWEDMGPATDEINRLRDEITALRARLEEVETVLEREKKDHKASIARHGGKVRQLKTRAERAEAEVARLTAELKGGKDE